MIYTELQDLIEKGFVKQVPLDISQGRIRYGHPDGYFVNGQGQLAKHTFAPSQVNNKGGSSYPGMRECIPRPCHVIMGITFYGTRPVFFDEKKGKHYGGICHHLIPNKLDYRPVNLLCWLTREEHRIADARMHILQSLVPNGNLYLFPLDLMRELQDPRVTSDAAFDMALHSVVPAALGKILPDCTPEPLRDV